MKVLGSTAVALAGVGRLPEWSGCCAAHSGSHDANDGFVDARDRSCTDREFDEIAAGEQVLTEEVLVPRARAERPAEVRRGRPQWRWTDQPRRMGRLQRGALRRRDRVKRRADEHGRL